MVGDPHMVQLRYGAGSESLINILRPVITTLSFIISTKRFSAELKSHEISKVGATDQMLNFWWMYLGAVHLWKAGYELKNFLVINWKYLWLLTENIYG